MIVLNTKETSEKILSIIENAKEWVVIASPYLKMRKRYMKALNKINVNATIIYGKCDLNYEVEEFLHECKSITIMYCEDLHAKIYMNEKECIITSMNLYDYSEKNNHEIGVYSKDIEMHKKTYKILGEIMQDSTLEKASKIALKESKKGYCIRTGVEIKFNPEKPFCYEAWLEWNKYKNPFYPENYCHKTGKKSKGKTSFANPTLFL